MRPVEQLSETERRQLMPASLQARPNIQQRRIFASLRRQLRQRNNKQEDSNMRLDDQDKQILLALDASFIVDDDKEVATLSGPTTITIIRTAADRLEMTVEFANIDFPIAMLRSQTLKSLGIEHPEVLKSSSDGIS